jgi:hypothetical protein
MNRKNRGSRDARSAGAWRSVLRRAAAPCHQAEESQFPVMREERCSGVVATAVGRGPPPCLVLLLMGRRGLALAT